MLNVVVLPAPLGPSRPTISPGCTWIDTPFTTRRLRYSLTRCSVASKARLETSAESCCPTVCGIGWTESGVIVRVSLACSLQKVQVGSIGGGRGNPFSLGTRLQHDEFFLNQVVKERLGVSDFALWWKIGRWIAGQLNRIVRDAVNAALAITFAVAVSEYDVFEGD